VRASAQMATMALGAAGVQVGTALMLCNEATTSAMHRAALQAQIVAEQPTALSTLFTGRPARGIVNRVMRSVSPLSKCAPEFPTAAVAIAPLRAAAEKNGNGDFSPLLSGQNAAQCKAVPAAQELRELAQGLALN
jgi:nitronate monooxygenase